MDSNVDKSVGGDEVEKNGENDLARLLGGVVLILEIVVIL